MSELRCRPIIMSGPMVTALISGRKRMTRRIVKPQPPPREDGSEGLYAHGTGWRYTDVDYPGEKVERCPYGAPGDTLWVREAWARNAHQTSDDRMDTSIVYRADGKGRAIDSGEELPWCSPIFMPRAFSRLTLRITDIRIERLMDISEADAEAEGFRASSSQEPGPEVPLGEHHTIQRMGEYVSAAGAFLLYWEKLHGEGSTLDNPLVWRIAFERATP